MFNPVINKLKELNVDFCKRFQAGDITKKGSHDIHEITLDIDGIEFDVRYHNSGSHGISLSVKSDVIWSSDASRINIDHDDEIEFHFSNNSFAVRHGNDDIAYLKACKSVSQLTVYLSELVLSIISTDGLKDAFLANKDVINAYLMEQHKIEKAEKERRLSEQKEKFDSVYELAFEDEKARKNAIRELKEQVLSDGVKRKVVFKVTDTEYDSENLSEITVIYDGSDFSAYTQKQGETQARSLYFKGKTYTKVMIRAAELLEYAVIEIGGTIEKPKAA